MSAREKVLGAAASLFYDYGIHATGISRITAKADVAKMSLYNHFPTKADLVVAYIEARHQEWLDLYAARLKQMKQAVTAEAGVAAVFDAYQDHAECEYENGFRGCGLLNAAAEFAAASPERQAVKRHKDEVLAILRSHIAALLPDETQAESAALMLAFLLEGAITRAGLEGNSRQIVQARAMALAWLAQQASPSAEQAS